MAGAQSEGSARGSPQAAQTPGLSSRTVDLPTADVSPTGGLAATPASAADAGFTPDSGEMPASAPEQNLPIWPWLLAAMALGVGGAFLFWRRNSREAFAGGPQIDAFAAPEPLPRPRTPPAAPAPRSAPKSLGIVSTRLRPWIELSFEPLRCIVEDDRVTFEFQLGLFNSGSAAARDVLIEASLFNASPTQEREIGTFFERPVGQGDRIPTIAPLKRVELRPQIVMTLDQVRVLEAGGRKVFVPLVAFNSLYRWGAGEGQTSAAYLIGRKTKAEKLAPFRLDLGARVFRGLDARLLPIGIRD